MSFWWLWTDFTHCSGVSIVCNKQVNASGFLHIYPSNEQLSCIMSDNCKWCWLVKIIKESCKKYVTRIMAFFDSRFLLLCHTAKKMKFSIKDFFSKCDLVTFTEEILNGKLHFLCSVRPPYFSISSFNKTWQTMAWNKKTFFGIYGCLSISHSFKVIRPKSKNFDLHAYYTYMC